MSIIMTTDFFPLSAYRLLRPSAADWCREHPASPIDGEVHPAVAEAGRGTSPPRAGGSPRSGVEGDPITISDGSGGDGSSKDARPMDEEVGTSPVMKRTPWPVGLRSVEEQRKRGGGARAGDTATAAGGAAAAAAERRGGAATRRSPARGAAGAGPATGAAGAPGAAAAEGPAVRGTARATISQSAAASATSAARA